MDVQHPDASTNLDSIDREKASILIQAHSPRVSIEFNAPDDGEEIQQPSMYIAII